MLGKKTSSFYSNPIRLTGIHSYTQERDKAHDQPTKASSEENIFSRAAKRRKGDGEKGENHIRMHKPINQKTPTNTAS